MHFPTETWKIINNYESNRKGILNKKQVALSSAEEFGTLRNNFKAVGARRLERRQNRARRLGRRALMQQ